MASESQSEQAAEQLGGLVSTASSTCASGLAAAAASGSAPQLQSAAPGIVRILLVEDTAVNALLARRMLRSGGITDVTHVENGELAVAAVRDGGPYDVVLIDCQMPVLDGYEATRRIRALADPVHSQVPIIALTASTMESDVQRSRSVGMNDHLPKPHTAAALLAMVKRWAAARGQQPLQASAAPSSLAFCAAESDAATHSPMTAEAAAVAVAGIDVTHHLTAS